MAGVQVKICSSYHHAPHRRYDLANCSCRCYHVSSQLSNNGKKQLQLDPFCGPLLSAIPITIYLYGQSSAQFGERHENWEPPQRHFLISLCRTHSKQDKTIKENNNGPAGQKNLQFLLQQRTDQIKLYQKTENSRTFYLYSICKFVFPFEILNFRRSKI